jgi:pilus assembly protein Flp/PilA
MTGRSGLRSWWHLRAGGWAVRGTFRRVREKDMKNLLVRFVREDEGQDLIEYALLAAFISLAAVLAIQQLGTAVNNVYTKVSSTLNTAGGS